MIENHEESRPQSGLSSADVIYEAVAEGGNHPIAIGVFTAARRWRKLLSDRFVRLEYILLILLLNMVIIPSMPMSEGQTYPAQPMRSVLLVITVGGGKVMI